MQKGLVLLLLAFAAIVSCWRHSRYYDDYNNNDENFYYNNELDGELEENREMMRRLVSSATRLPIDIDEIRGLQYLYNSTNGEYWRWQDDITNYGIRWNFTADLSLVHPCYDHWQGILCSCNSSHKLNTLDYYYNSIKERVQYYYDDIENFPSNDSCHITKIYLPRYNLSFVLPGEMFVLLPNLTHLHLEENLLYSPLPAEMNQSSLELIKINDNRFEESLDVLGSITSLQVLVAYRNGFAGDLTPLQNLISLNYLDLEENSLTGTLHAGNLNSLQDLKVIFLSNNLLSGNLSEISDLVGLKRLTLGSNSFTGSIDAVRKLTNLQGLYLFSNSFTGSIEAVSNLTHLEWFYLDFNSFTGSIEAVNNLVNLFVLTMFSNSFTGSNDDVSTLINLEWLDLRHNLFSGSIDAVSTLTNLQTIFMESNSFSGSIDAVSTLTNLQTLELSSNTFTGSIETVRTLTNLEYLHLGSNSFTGSIDAVSTLTNLQTLYLASNSFTGSIEAVSTHINLQGLYLYSNSFSGSIETVRTLTNLVSLYLYSNSFTGSIEAVSTLTNLKDLILFVNYFTGTIDALRNLDELLVVDLSNNMLSGTLEPIGGLMQLQVCKLDHNSFTGPIPSLHASNMLPFIVGSNQLTGSLLPGGFPNSTTIIDVSDNRLSGELPMELYSLPNLQILSAGVNCLSARFTDQVCSASTLSTLLLDGLHSASSCRETIPVHVFDTIYASYQAVSSLPSCIYSLQNMTNLHLSGNGIIGSLPTDVTLNDGFVELVISNNAFRSSIPEAFQTHKWKVFDVSYNKFTGTLLPSLDVADTARLSINRISGYIPSSLHNTTDVAVLTGNIFACTHKELIRLNDVVQDRYVCGSSSFTNAGLLWFSVVMVAAVTIGLSYISYVGCSTPVLDTWIGRLLAMLHDLRTRFVSSSDLTRVTAVVLGELKLTVNISEIEQFTSLCHIVRVATGFVAAVFVCLHLPLYCIFSSYFGSYSVTYAWTASAAYLSGLAPGLTLWLVYLFSFLIPGAICAHYRSSLRRLLHHRHHRDDDINGGSVRQRNISAISLTVIKSLIRKTRADGVAVTNKESSAMVQRRLVVFCLIFAVNLVVVVALNIAYILIVLNYNDTVVTLAEVGMGVFKAGWTNMVVVEVYRQLGKRYIKSANTMDARGLSFLALTSILNNIVIPCLALSLASPDCFYNLIYSREDVSSSYYAPAYYSFDGYEYVTFNASRFTINSHLTFTPPYSYSYQCSSAILTSYTVIFLYSALIGLISQPFKDKFIDNLPAIKEQLATCMRSSPLPLLRSMRSVAYNEKTPVIVPVSDEGRCEAPVTTPKATSGDLSPPIITPNGSNKIRSPVNPTILILQLVTIIAVMLSFGCVFPFLAFILFLTIIGQTKYAEYRIGRYLEASVSSPTYSFDEKLQRVSQLNDDLRDIQQKVTRSLWQVIPWLGPFYGIFAFDMIGDTSSMKEAIFAPIILVFTSVAVYLAPYYYLHEVSDEDISYNSSSDRTHPLKQTQVSPVDDDGDTGTTTDGVVKP